MSWVIGSIFTLTAIIQLWRIFRHKDAIHQLEHPEEMTERITKQADAIDDNLDKIAFRDEHPK